MNKKVTYIVCIISIILSVLSILISLSSLGLFFIDQKTCSFGIAGNYAEIAPGDEICYINRYGDYCFKTVDHCGTDGCVYFDVTVEQNGSAYMGLKKSSVYKVIWHYGAEVYT